MLVKESFWKQHFPRMYDKKYWPVLILFFLVILSMRVCIYPALMEVNVAVDAIKTHDQYQTTLFDWYNQETTDKLVEWYYKKVDSLYYSLAWPLIFLALMIMFPYLNARFRWIE